jgi:hypothetical protein
MASEPLQAILHVLPKNMLVVMVAGSTKAHMYFCFKDKTHTAMAVA